MRLWRVAMILRNGVNTVIKSKRGHKVCARQNKLAQGIAKMCADNRIKASDELLRLHVYGTLDILTKKLEYAKSTTRQHPADPSYTKRVQVIGRAGKRRLTALRNA